MADQTPGDIRHKVESLRQNVSNLQANISSKLRDPTSFVHTKAKVVYKMFLKRADHARRRSKQHWEDAQLQSWLEKERLAHDVNKTSEMFINDLDLVAIQLERLSLSELSTNEAKFEAFESWAALDARAQEIYELCEVMYNELFTAFPDLPIDEPEGFETPCDVQDMEIVRASSSTRDNLERLNQLVARAQGPDPFGSKFSEESEEETEIDLMSSRRLVDEKLQRAKEAITANDNAIRTLSEKTEGIFNMLGLASETPQLAADKSKLADLRDEQSMLRGQLLDLQAERNAILSQIQGE